MRRRDLLTGALGAGAASALTVPQARAAAPEFRFRMVTAWPKNSPGLGVNAQRLADLIGTLSGGRIAVSLAAAGEIVPPFEVFDAVAGGVAEMGHATPYYWSGKAPVFHLFTGVPFGLFADEHQAWLEFGGGQALWDEAYAPFGVRPFYAGSSGIQAGGWFTKPVRSLDDLRGLKFRIAGLGGAVFERLGATVTLTPPGEIFPALQSGALDAAEWVGPWNDLAFGLDRIARHYYLPAFHELGAAVELIVREEVWQGLPGDLQAVIETAARAVAGTTLAEFTAMNASAFERLRSDESVTIAPWPDDVVAAARVAGDAVLNELAASGALAARTVESWRAFRARATAWSRAAAMPGLSFRA